MAGEIIILTLPYVASVAGWYKIHVVGGGQAGFDGHEVLAGDFSPGGDGGFGGSYCQGLIVFLNIGDTISGSIGAGGASNGALGGDTEILINGVFLCRAAGGGTGSTTTGLIVFNGGVSRARVASAGYPIGRGGGGGGGAAGPNGDGGDGGELSPACLEFGGAGTSSDGGTGGGAANGGDNGTEIADLVRFHLPYTGGVNNNDILQYVPGDGGDSIDPTYWLIPPTNPVISWIGPNQAGAWGSGGAGAVPNFAFLPYIIDTGCDLYSPIPGTGRRNATNSQQLSEPGGAGFIWGNVPNWATTSPAYSVGFSAGPGGGGGGGAGGNIGDFSRFGNGAFGANYGGGGGGGGNWLDTSEMPVGLGGRGGDGVIALEITTEPPPVPGAVFFNAPVYPPIHLPHRYRFFGPTKRIRG